VNFILNEQNINANIPKATTIAYHSISLQTYLCNKHKWTNSVTDSIWWKIHHRSISKQNSTDQTRIQKFVHNYMPTNHQLNIYDPEHPAECECRKHQIETETLVIRYPSEKWHTIQEKWLQELNIFLGKPHTCAELKCCIIENTTAWLNDENPCEFNNNSQKIWQPPRGQGRIGWDHFIRGRVAMS
jgi:hypothetical protein